MSVTFFPIINNPMDLTAEPENSDIPDNSTDTIPDNGTDNSNKIPDNSTDNSNKIPDNATDTIPDDSSDDFGFNKVPEARFGPDREIVEIKSFITLDCHAVKLDISKATPTRKTEWWSDFEFGDFVRPKNKVYGLVVDGDQVIWKSTKPNESGLKVELFYLLDKPDMVIILLANLRLHISQKYKCEECEKMTQWERIYEWRNKSPCKSCKARDEWIDVSDKYLDPAKFRFTPADVKPEKQTMNYEVSLGGYNYEIKLEEPCTYLTYGDRILFDQRGKTKGLSVIKINYHIVGMTLMLKLTNGKFLHRKYKPENKIKSQNLTMSYYNEEIYNVSKYCKECTTKNYTFWEPIREERFKKTWIEPVKKRKHK
ncbi:hypothetical protein TpMuguga_03g00194 [Theileria parva strain Muguga]|uniref:Uncharacterized protein n=1 Tax=Theileria parva TaxID=5875 RepID=Q4N0F0_THEPA|nr:uncharacterized protein TpMuguga_03g00194 [Theileria parva strain Muguga]EAN30929.1 hypothetical protein TpMuguga_03g00194 [Theileria parva strain Muguga]|eukprot:XP_763212.1 hypothetical protein [Theileria parva strain Muguga]